MHNQKTKICFSVFPELLSMLIRCICYVHWFTICLLLFRFETQKVFWFLRLLSFIICTRSGQKATRKKKKIDWWFSCFELGTYWIEINLVSFPVTPWEKPSGQNILLSVMIMFARYAVYKKSCTFTLWAFIYWTVQKIYVQWRALSSASKW